MAHNGGLFGGRNPDDLSSDEMLNNSMEYIKIAQNADRTEVEQMLAAVMSLSAASVAISMIARDMSKDILALVQQKLDDPKTQLGRFTWKDPHQ